MNWDCFAVSILFYIFAKKINMTDEFGFNDGDILVIRNWILIYAGYKESNIFGPTRHTIIFYALMNFETGSLSVYPNNPRPGIGYIETNPKPRYATNEEIFHFFEKIKSKNNMKWDFKNKKFEAIEKYEYVC